MKTCVIVLTAVLLHSAGFGRAEAQTVDGLRIFVRASVGRTDGGNRGGTAGAVDPEHIGETATFTFSRLTGQCGTGVGTKPLEDVGVASDGTLKKVDSAWTVQVTPTGRTGDAVTFRLQWVRSRDNGKPSTVSDDVNLTLSPGQSMSVDVLPLSTEASGASTSCKSMWLRVGLERDPEPNRDRRLLAVDLWLVWRGPDGTERSQPLSLRGLYNQPIPFYFDSLTEGTKTPWLVHGLR